jgi:hypothetical protein
MLSFSAKNGRFSFELFFGVLFENLSKNAYTVLISWLLVSVAFKQINFKNLS